MSFTYEVRNELAHVMPACDQCDRAVLAALVRMEGTLLFRGPGNYALELITDDSCVARLMIRLIHDLYNLKTELTVRRSVLHKTPNYLIVLPVQQGIEEVLYDLGVLGEQGLVQGIETHLIENDCCKAAYLRGAFLGSGFVSSPRGDFHFEITTESEDLAQDIVNLLVERDIPARSTKRRNTSTVYLKSGSAISDFLALTGAHQCMLTMEDERVIKSVRNDVNRRVNAEVANQAKSAQSSVQQIMTIRKILEKRGIESLPPALQEYIKLRVKYPDATLKELGEYADPPLSKSAIYHRVRRVEKIAKELEEKCL